MVDYELIEKHFNTAKTAIESEKKQTPEDIEFDTIVLEKSNDVMVIKLGKDAIEEAPITWIPIRKACCGKHQLLAPSTSYYSSLDPKCLTEGVRDLMSSSRPNGHRPK